MNTEILKRLEDAINTGEILYVKYNGGSKPGTSREIRPISINNGMVYSDCLTSRSTKSFNIEKLELLSRDISKQNKNWNEEIVRKSKYEDLEDFFTQEKQKLLDLGWHINFTEGASLSLHKSLRGRVLKKYEVSFDLQKQTADMVLNLDNGKIEAQNIRDRERPYTIRATKMTTKSYRDLEKACVLFLEQAQLLAPVII